MFVGDLARARHVPFFLAHEYETMQNNRELLQDFFAGSASKVKTAGVRQWLTHLMDCRSTDAPFQLPSDSNLKTILKDILYDEQGESRCCVDVTSTIVIGHVVTDV
jgi:hypothetical protein